MIDDIRRLVESGRYRLTLHARSEMGHDSLSTGDLVSALARPSSEVIEDYPEDSRGHSHLLLAWLSPREPLHVLCAVHEDLVVVITVYRPNKELWTRNWRRRT